MTHDFYKTDQKTRTDVWLTPPNIITELGLFDLDPCCPSDLSWKTAEEHFSLERGQDGLALPWHGRVWLNPPYSNWGAWTQKLSDHGNGIALIFARTETKAFFNTVWERATAILFVKGRIKFLRHNPSTSSSVSSATAPSVLVAYGKDNAIALSLSTLGKTIWL